MSEDDVLFGYRLRVLDYPARTSVSEACRFFGIHRSTITCGSAGWSGTGWRSCARGSAVGRACQPAVAVRRGADRRLRARPPRYGPRRIAIELRCERWGGIVISHNGVWHCLRRHGLNARAKRLVARCRLCLALPAAA